MKNKAKVVMNKPAYCGLLILEISKISMYNFQSDQIKPKNKEKSQ